MNFSKVYQIIIIVIWFFITLNFFHSAWNAFANNWCEAFGKPVFYNNITGKEIFIHAHVCYDNSERMWNIIFNIVAPLIPPLGLMYIFRKGF